MFTGIITDMGTVASLVPAESAAAGDFRITLSTVYDTAAIDLGASIACSGCCLTVVDKGGDWVAFDVSGETLSKTTLGTWAVGSRVNLERALKAGDELGGHIVSGHVDGTGSLVSVAEDRGSWRLRIQVPAEIAPFVAPKGSIAVDGVSLTVNEVEGACFGVNIIPHTWTHTTLGQLQPGAAVNLEIDMLARYVARLLESRG